MEASSISFTITVPNFTLRDGFNLQIRSGTLESLVQGSRSKPYTIKIKITSPKKNTWKNIQTSCHGEFDSLQELLTGQFPKSLSSIFTDPKTGFFPSPREISFHCSCPDWADMCKHVAATLYGIGARLDENPELFFTLRNVKMTDLVTESIKEHKDTLLNKAQKKSSKVIDDVNLSEVFGIDVDMPIKAVKKKRTGKVKPVAKKVLKKKTPKKKPVTKKPSSRKKSSKRTQ